MVGYITDDLIDIWDCLYQKSVCLKCAKEQVWLIISQLTFIFTFPHICFQGGALSVSDIITQEFWVTETSEFNFLFLKPSLISRDTLYRQQLGGERL